MSAPETPPIANDAAGAHSLHRLVGLLDDMLNNAQTLRIQQSQAAADADWPKRLTEKSDAAWQHLNAAHKAATELLQPNVRHELPPK